MDLQLKIQYTIVGVIILAAIVWVAVRVYRTRRNRSKLSSGCCGCALSDACNRPDAKPLHTPRPTKSDSAGCPNCHRP